MEIGNKTDLITQFKILLEQLNANEIDSVREWLEAAISNLSGDKSN